MRDAAVEREKLPAQVLILADESAAWKIAGLCQLDRLLLSLEEFAAGEQITFVVRIWWSVRVAPNERLAVDETRFPHLEWSNQENAAGRTDEGGFVLSTRLFLFRRSLPQLRPALTIHRNIASSWDLASEEFQKALPRNAEQSEETWQYLSDRSDIRACERRFLSEGGKSQDGLVSRHLNRPISRTLSRWLLKLPISPTMWSVGIFSLPLIACSFLLHGSRVGFVLGCAIYQTYSILDGCDGEIARAKFMQTEFGRRLDSFCDLVGNILLALCLGLGLTRHYSGTASNGWFYAAEGILAAALILLSEGIVFARRERPDTETISTKWTDALYQRHHEFFERSGILLLGETFAWWVVQLTKRDMAMLAFLLLASLGWSQWILHLQVLVGGISSALAGNVFLRPAPVALPEEAG
ncbi:MAG: CDP-alcohol phosphatidyltransferase family protein [Verrucomicrobiota bacterium]|nr:CDP-alcohol phosphatidyltransferase family protein [Verrucomicrobiota bacterium]